MQHWNDYRAENTVRQSWMIYCFPHLQRKAHIAKLEDLLNALLKNSLRISPKKCQLFKTELQYMRNIIFIKDRKVCVKLLRNRLEAIQKLRMPKTPKCCQSFTWKVNFLSMFCPELQKLLIPYMI